MGLFIEAAEKFLGFAGKKAVDKSLSEIPGQAAAFIKGLDQAADAAEYTFDVSGPQWERTIKLMKGEKFVGNVGFKVDAKGVAKIYGSVVSKEFRGKGLGQQLYRKAFQEAKAGGSTIITSDPTHISQDASRVWEALGKKGFNVEKFEITPGAQGYRLSLGDEITQNNIEFQKTTLIAQEVMRAGEGNDNTTLLNRSLRSVRGSRRTSAAL